MRAVAQLVTLISTDKEGRQSKLQGGRVDLRSETDWRARKFLSERNMYLSASLRLDGLTRAAGFTLFLALILSRTYSLILVRQMSSRALTIAGPDQGARGAGQGQTRGASPPWRSC